MFTILENYKTLMRMCMSADMANGPELSAASIDRNGDNFADMVDFSQMSESEKVAVRGLLDKVGQEVYMQENFASKVENEGYAVSMQELIDRGYLPERGAVIASSQENTAYVADSLNTGVSNLAVTPNTHETVQTTVTQSQYAPVEGFPNAPIRTEFPLNGDYEHGARYVIGGVDYGVYDQVLCGFRQGEIQGLDLNRQVTQTEAFTSFCENPGTPGCNTIAPEQPPVTTYTVTPAASVPQVVYVVPTTQPITNILACDINSNGLDDKAEFKRDLETSGFQLTNHPEIDWYGTPNSGVGRDLVASGYEGYDYVKATVNNLPGFNGQQEIIIKVKESFKQGYGNPKNSSFRWVQVDSQEVFQGVICGLPYGFPTLKKGGWVDPGTQPDPLDPNGGPSGGPAGGPAGAGNASAPSAGGTAGNAAGNTSF